MPDSDDKMPKAHMIRTIPRRRRGRPRGPAPVFVDSCFQIDAVKELAKSRGGRVGDDPVVFRTLVWTDCGRQQTRTIALPVTSTLQPLGGRRHWWLCTTCGARRRFLLAAKPDGPIGCRGCWQAQHISDYPSRHRDRLLVEVVRSIASGSLDEERAQELSALGAARRRGVRRGRRIGQRADRLAFKIGDVGFQFVKTWGSPEDRAEMAAERARIKAALEAIRTFGAARRGVTEVQVRCVQAERSEAADKAYELGAGCEQRRERPT